jgi:hypothetical protein
LITNTTEEMRGLHVKCLARLHAMLPRYALRVSSK